MNDSQPVNSDVRPDIDFGSISLLIEPSRAGDPQARDQLLAEMKSYLESTANRHMDPSLRQKVGPSDIVQSSFVNVIENFHKFRGGSSGEFRSWLKTIVVNELRRVQRHYHTDKRDMNREMCVDQKTPAALDHAAADQGLTPSSEAICREQKEIFHRILNQLNPEYAQVIELRNIQRLSFKEIGQRMDRSESAATKLWYRAILKFETKLKSNKDVNPGGGP